MISILGRVRGYVLLLQQIESALNDCDSANYYPDMNGSLACHYKQFIALRTVRSAFACDEV